MTGTASRIYDESAIEIDSIVFWIGQRWRENDKRFQRIVEVSGWDISGKRIRLGKVRYTWAAARRFNGRSGGYVRA